MKIKKIKHEDKELWQEIDQIKGLSQKSKENAYHVLSDIRRRGK